MVTHNSLKKIGSVALAGLLLGMVSTEACAEHRDEHHRGDRHERIAFRGERFDYHEGRFYRPAFFGFSFNWVIPPAGAIVSYLPERHRTIIIGGITYYEYDNVYYQPCSRGYVVVPQPLVINEYVAPNIVYFPAPASVTPQQSRAGDRETVTINVPKGNGGYIAITLVRYPNEFVGPQGESYPVLPTGEQLKARYGN